MVKVIYKNVKIKIFDLALSEKIAEEVFWGILPKISKGDKVSLGLSAMLTQTGLIMMRTMMHAHSLCTATLQSAMFSHQ